MSRSFAKIAQVIVDEFDDLEQTVHRVEEAWLRFQQSEDSLYLDSVALNLHSFYSGLERLFELIAKEIDEAVPQGANWHRLLLEQMTTERSNVRPIVIS